MSKNIDNGQMFKAENGEWTWHIKASGNHEVIISAGGETYNNLADMEEMLYSRFSADRVRWVNLDHFNEDDGA